MLTITRKVGESVMIGEDVEVKVTRLEGGDVRLSIQAPRSIGIFRRELYDRIKASGEPLLAPDQREG